ncbi:AhpD family alkylhydroperoxidase [Actinomadura namibiensis]|uniref:AhpD family alkylhydroperoxidase n=1 Tax=Actinomadura namibiensis TaxID=182080 RepID=A0A7W3LRN6_ACTNM|nr:carboxymuconolactone decarboxylase family protein [Actinomadura namibiensis]MBA8953034.1 AhpD family alkylhydroperoxidase [Actinomadura namibiensis]
MAGAFARVTRRGAQGQVRHVSAVRHEAARGRVAEIYAQVERDFGILAPPVTLHSPAPDLLAAAWMTLRETLVASGRADRAVKETVASAVSLGNSCRYCADVHGMTLHGLVRGRDAAAIAEGRLEAVADPRIRAVAAWARDLGTGEAGGGRPAPFPAGQASELVGVAVVFHYLNRVVNVFLEESPFPPGLPARARGGMMRLVGRCLRPNSLRHRAPGRSLHLLPAAPPPGDMAWADGAPVVADAFARAAAAVDAAAERSVPAPVRQVVRAELAGWDGRPPGLSRSWTEGALAVLPASDRPAGRLALLTAMASYQVDRSVIEDYRKGRSGDAPLVELVSWAAFTASRRVGALAAG